MKILKVAVLFLVVSTLSSCLTCKKPFKQFKSNVNNSLLDFNVKGIYVSDESKMAFFFFSNGLVKECSLRKQGDFEDVVNGVRVETNSKDDKFYVSDYDYNSKELWGNYEVEKDSSLNIQVFGNCRDCACRRMVIEYKGKLISNSTWELLSSYYYDTPNSFEKRSKQYYLTPLTLKPDSTKAWFVNRNWYKKGLHPSRK